jgi:ComF family protein
MVISLSEKTIWTAEKAWQKALDLLLPPRCVLCRQPSGSICICNACKSDLPWLGPQCKQCGLPLPTAINRPHEKSTCGKCIKHPPPFNNTISPLLYSFPVDTLVRALKFHCQLAEGRVLSHLLCEHIVIGKSALPDSLIPVPLHNMRMIKRGFNQAFELGRYTSKVLGIPFLTSGLRRKRNTSAQSGLSRKQRQSNVRDAFYWHGLQTPGRHVALIDDVMTTGTTVSECTKVLMRAGAKRVDVWVPVRAVPAI